MGAARRAGDPGVSWIFFFRCGAAFDEAIVGEPVQTINVATDNLLLRYVKLRENPHQQWLCGLQQRLVGSFAQIKNVTFSPKVSVVRSSNVSHCCVLTHRIMVLERAQIVISRYKRAQVGEGLCVTLRGIRFRTRPR